MIIVDKGKKLYENRGANAGRRRKDGVPGFARVPSSWVPPMAQALFQPVKRTIKQTRHHPQLKV